MNIKEVFEMSAEQREALTDVEIKSIGYAICYYEPFDKTAWESWWERDREIKLELKARLDRIESAERAARQASAKPVEMAKCARCGRSVPRAALFGTNTRGAVCEDCYDQMGAND